MSGFAPTFGIPKLSYDGKRGPSFDNATWFNAGPSVKAIGLGRRVQRTDLRERATACRDAALNTPKSRRLARRDKALLAKIYLKASRNYS